MCEGNNKIEVVAAIIRDEQGRYFATQRGYGVIVVEKLKNYISKIEK